MAYIDRDDKKYVSIFMFLYLNDRISTPTKLSS